MQNAFSNKKSIVKSILKIVITNLISLLSGILVGFLLPKVIGVSDYGYYKTFTLYAGYVGLLHFGFIDGIYLRFGGKNYNELNRESFRFFSRLLLFFELVLSFIGLLFSIFFLSANYRYIFIFVSLYIVGHNMMTYFQYISQITGRFTELAIVNLMYSFLTVFSVVVVFVMYRVSGQIQHYYLFLAFYSLTPFLLDIVYLILYRQIFFGKTNCTKALFFESWKLITLGFPLMIANLCSSLILSIDRQFVNILFDTDTYAIYAFAYNMLALITTAISAISIVIYPMMKRMDLSSLIGAYGSITSIILFFVFGCLLVYFPLAWFIPAFLPAYELSIPIFRIILPGLAISSTITIVMHNYYKTVGKELSFFLKSVFVLLISIIGNLLAYFLIGSTASISVASIASLLIWYILVERFFIIRYKVKWMRNLGYVITMMLGFYLITTISVWWAAMLIYLLFYLFVTTSLYESEIRFLFNEYFKRDHKIV